MGGGLLGALQRLLDGPAAREPTDPLAQAVAAHMPEASEDERRLVAAVAGLLASVAFADAVYTDEERRHVREELARIHGLPPRGAEAICAVLDASIGQVTAAGDQRWVRAVKELADHGQRREIVEVLMGIAAADGDFSLAEQSYLRRLAVALGLSHADYVRAQAHHRDSLSLLKSR